MFDQLCLTGRVLAAVQTAVDQTLVSSWTTLRMFPNDLLCAMTGHTHSRT